MPYTMQRFPKVRYTTCHSAVPTPMVKQYIPFQHAMTPKQTHAIEHNETSAC